MLPLRDSAPRFKLPWVTWGLITLNISIFLFELHLPPSFLGRTLLPALGLVPAHVTTFLAGAPIAPLNVILPFFSSMFLHAGWLHVLGNMWMLYLFGDNVEDVLGHGRFLGFYLACGLVAGLTQCLFQPHSTVPTIGASGAIAGVMGGYLIHFPHARVLTLVPFLFFWAVELPAWAILGYWFFLQLLSGTALLALSGAVAEGGVAWFAHLGGFITGAFLVKWVPSEL
ncbi:MAG: rhomboid family intramembrane serine protease [Terriglobales bacterium]